VADDFLWDGSGTPDPEVERLTQLLRPLRHDRPAPAFPEMASTAPVRTRRTGEALAAAAVVVFAVSSLVVVARRPPATGWNVARLEGQPRVGETPVGEHDRLGLGDWVETDATSRARIAVGAIGDVELRPRTRVRLVDAGRESHRLSLVRGEMLARIWGRPGQFRVDTPSATAVDLGCIYTLSVDEAGAGLLTVQVGWVAFALEGRESFVPAGARCATRRERGPGTPYFLDAPERLKEALAALDSGAAPARPGALDAVLEAARPRDALSLWHLLSSLEDADRPRAYERLASFVPPPPGVTRDGVLRGDRAMLDLWWDALDLGPVSLWREWERPWTASKRFAPSPR
jgi:hypothetical protein